MANSFTIIFLTFMASLCIINSSIIAFDQNNQIESDKIQLQNQKDRNENKNQRDWEFSDFKTNFGKIYDSDTQEKERTLSYQQNMKKLKQNVCSPCGVTSLMDKNQDQLNGNIFSNSGLKELLPGKGDSAKNNKKGGNKRLLQTLTATPIVTPPLNFDWRKYNVVSLIRNQKDCGSCWAFTTTAFFESELIRRNQTIFLIDLAEQFLYQCENASYGCQGGYLNTALQLVLNTGIPRQASFIYNYQSNYSNICTTSSISSYNMKLNGSSNVIGYTSRTTKLSDDQIIQLLLQRPLMLGVYADDWFYYKPTASDRTIKCIMPLFGSYATAIDHAVLLVGYTETEWIIKNSWGSSFGVNGFIYVSRDPLYNCGVGFHIYTLDYQLPVPKF